MNKPVQPLTADPDIGPLDEHGQQVWSPEEEAAIARMKAQPGFWEGLTEAEAEIDRGEVYTTEEVEASMVAMKRQWFADRGMTPPPAISTLEGHLVAARKGRPASHMDVCVRT